MNLLKHYFPLRRDCVLEIYLPRDLNLDEAGRLSKWIMTLAQPSENEPKIEEVVGVRNTESCTFCKQGRSHEH